VAKAIPNVRGVVELSNRVKLSLKSIVRNVLKKPKEKILEKEFGVIEKNVTKISHNKMIDFYQENPTIFGCGKK
jgi:hypothetical protein